LSAPRLRWTAPGMMTPVTTMTDLGKVLATQLLDTALASISGLGLTAPKIALFIAGASIPIEDCCEGLLWTRVATQYPSNGGADPFTEPRIDFDLPAVVFAIEMGCLWCHNNVESDGSAIDPAEETTYANRDGDYRGALYKAAAYDLPPLIKPCSLGHRIDPWAPIGPDGACSGGMLVDRIVCEAPFVML
jgi:hypothetical protein